MNIFELLPFLRGAHEPVTPADSLPAIVERLNGSSGDPVQVSRAIDELLSARSSWSVYQQDLKQHLAKLGAEGASEKKLDGVNNAILKANLQINLLNEGEAPLKQRLIKARTDAVNAGKSRGQTVLAAELKPIIESLVALMDRAAPLIAQVNRGEIPVDPRFIQSVMPGLAWVTQYVVQNRSHFAIALSALAREYIAPTEPAQLAPPRIVKFLSNRKLELDGRIVELPTAADADPPRTPVPAIQPPQSGVQHPVFETAGPMQVLPLQPLQAKPRNKDDLSPLGPAEMRCRVLRAGYETPDGVQCNLGQVVKLPNHVARKAIGNNAVVALEMHIDRTKVEGASWQGADVGSLAILGAGGTRVTEQPDKRAPAASAQQPNEGDRK